MDPDCCGSNCHHGKSAGLLDVAYWTHNKLLFWRKPLGRAGDGCKTASHHQGCSERIIGDEVEVHSAKADGPVERETFIRSILVRRK
jgi:hypothetical protein